MKSIIESHIYTDELKIVANHISDHTGSFLITGATGLIGSCIIDALLWTNENLNHTHKIFAVGRSKKKMEERFKYAKTSEWLHFIEQDICNPLKIDCDVDYVIHAASNADPRSYALYPVETILTNILGTQNILEYCKKYSVKRLLFTSTFEVYGELPGIDIFEETMCGTLDTTILRNCYPESKRCAETLVRCSASEYKINAVIARLCSIYGPTMQCSDSKVHAQFIKNALNCQDIVLKSPGTQIRTYCYVLDAVDALLKILFDGASKEIYNISNEKSVISIAELARTVAEISGTQVVFDIPDSIEQKGFSKPQNCILSNRKLRSLGWEGKYSIENGIRQTLFILKEIGT